MTRVKSSVSSRKRRKQILKGTRGFFGNKSRLFRYAKDSYERAKKYSYRDRKKNKTNFRKSWIAAINQTLRLYGFKYSSLIFKLKEGGLQINRKSLCDLATKSPIIFKFFVISLFK
jgi:large subunit ribosomal protein L20